MINLFGSCSFSSSAFHFFPFPSLAAAMEGGGEGREGKIAPLLPSSLRLGKRKPARDVFNLPTQRSKSFKRKMCCKSPCVVFEVLRLGKTLPCW